MRMDFSLISSRLRKISNLNFIFKKYSQLLLTAHKLLVKLISLCYFGVVHKWRHGRRGKGQGFCDNSTKASLIKSVTKGGGGVKKCPKLRNVIYGRPLYTSKMTIHWGQVFFLFRPSFNLLLQTPKFCAPKNKQQISIFTFALKKTFLGLSIEMLICIFSFSSIIGS
jgi:hypothetical protein